MTKYTGFKTLEVLEGADNYNKWIAKRVGEFIKSPALEVGAGIGSISEHLLHIDALTITDLDDSLVKLLARKFSKRKNVATKTLDISKDVSKEKKRFKTIYSVNVLEHIKNDVEALKNMRSLLDANGNIVMLVPAKKRVFSHLDKELGHFRRYEKDEIVGKLKNAGYKSVSAEYFNMLGLLSWYVRDKIDSKNTQLNPSHVKIFDSIVPFLMKFEPKKGLKAGISLIVTGKKL